ncbi:hypothetical protein ACHWQZ_G008564 [Mnemiopsis leidyi]
MTIHCNDEVAINLIFSNNINGDCDYKWNAYPLVYVQFPTTDTASKMYRAKPAGKCTGLNLENLDTSQLSVTYPVESSTEINVECDTVGANEGKKLFGDSTVTCYGDTYFLYDELPKCIAPATCDKLPAGRMIPYVIPGVTEPFSLEPGIQISLSCYDGFQLDQGSPSATCFSGMYFEYSGTNGDLPKCIPTATSGWEKVEPGKTTIKKIENMPFEVITNSAAKSYDKLTFDINGQEMTLRLSGGDLTAEYKMNFGCSSDRYTLHATATLPEAAVKIWTFFSTKTSFLIHCNDQIAANITFDDGINHCGRVWSRDITQIRFRYLFDTASDYYRFRQPADCHGLDPTWEGMTSDPDLSSTSIGSGTVVTLSCEDGTRLFGDKEVTCYSGTLYTFTRPPQCIPPGTCTRLPAKLERFKMLSHTDQDYPIPAGEVLTLSCEEDFQLIGPTTLTCQNGQHYYHEEGEGEPKCEPTPESELTNHRLHSGEVSTLLLIWKNRDGYITYRLEFCSPNKNTGYEIPKENTNKTSIWTVYRSEGFFSVYYDKIRVVHISYDEQVSTFCEDRLKTQKKLKFEVLDLLSSYYRTKLQGQCSGLDPSWKDMDTEVVFPVSSGAKVTLTCQKSQARNIGDSEVICYGGTFFLFNRQPFCLEPAECSAPSPNREWSYLLTTAEFPVQTGSVVQLLCAENLILEGQDSITCFSGGHYDLNPDKKPACTVKDSATEFSDWNLITRNELILHDLENFPLEILSNSELGGNEQIKVDLFDANKSRISYMVLNFREIAQHELLWVIFCATTKISKSVLPDTPNNVWKVTKTTSSIQLHCNGENVAEVNFDESSDESSSSISGECKDLVKRDVHYIKIQKEDTASDFLKQQDFCGKLPEDLTDLVLAPSLPVLTGTVLQVSCDKIQQHGDTNITCIQGRRFGYLVRPLCRDSGKLLQNSETSS